MIAETVSARALTTRFSHVYTPPVEVSPLVFVPFFDLELPNEARCNEARDLVRSAIFEAATEIAGAGAGGAEIMMMDSVEIAVAEGVPCRQSNDRTFGARAVAEEIMARVDAQFGHQRRVRVVFVYATNLNLDLPSTLVTSFQILRTFFLADESRRDLLLAIGPERPVSALAPERSIAWIATDEPMFRATIKGLLETLWPFKTLIHTDQTVVPLVELDDVERFQKYRICTATADVFPLGESAADRSAIVAPPDGPAYLVHLPSEVLVDTLSFVPQSVMVSWEGCEALCDHPGPRAVGDVPWEIAGGCE